MPLMLPPPPSPKPPSPPPPSPRPPSPCLGHNVPCSAWFCCAAYTCANTTTNSTACATKPQPPSSVYLSPAGRSVLVYLSLPPDTGGINIPITSYRILGRAAASDAPKIRKEELGTATADPNVTYVEIEADEYSCGEDYEFTVWASNEVGESEEPHGESITPCLTQGTPCASYFCCASLACINNTAGAAVCAGVPGKPTSLFLSMDGKVLDVIVRPPTQTGGDDIGKCQAGARKALRAITGYRVLAQSSTGANFTTTSPGSPSSLIPGTRVIEIAPDVYQCGVPYAVSVWSINDAGQSAEPIEYGNGSNTFTPAC
ncbi:expressed protein [Chlorella variabilis]|uniref:Expressed protein n=1 Tax=Chlorella variabilis TaxID=554065 RepID=E1Z676_CHLVA|nr:expressed protein [Chlorella variabilis]EFN58600.1 expressed protein [Chlorella variabilis]|eukprot:XP_005850702.1 expressed protein [Chlorella variabilis]